MSGVLFDLYPAALDPWPADVPRRRVRAVATAERLAVLWEGPNRTVERWFAYAEPAGATPAGGTVAGISVSRAAGCRCGARTVQNLPVDRI